MYTSINISCIFTWLTYTYTRRRRMKNLLNITPIINTSVETPIRRMSVHIQTPVCWSIPTFTRLFAGPSLLPHAYLLVRLYFHTPVCWYVLISTRLFAGPSLLPHACLLVRPYFHTPVCLSVPISTRLFAGHLMAFRIEYQVRPIFGQSWIQTTSRAPVVSYSKILYPHCLVLYGSKNRCERDFKIKLNRPCGRLTLISNRLPC